MRLIMVGCTIWVACFVAFMLMLHKPTPVPAALPAQPAALFDLANDKSIVRLHTSDEGRFFCSGIVISERLIATAAHCIIRGSLFGDDNVLSEVEIRARDMKPTGIRAKVKGYNSRLDTALLEGDFHLFPSRPIAQDSNYLHLVLTNPESRLVACGFPLGSELRCSPFTKVRRQDFFYRGLGYLYPGQSGGPVIDLDTGLVLGVNHAVQDDQIIINPLAEFMNDMNG